MKKVTFLYYLLSINRIMRYQDYNCRNLSRFLYPVEVSLFNSKDIIDIAIRNIYGNIEDELCITQKNKKISFYSKETSFKVLYRKIAYDLLKNYGGKTPSRNKIIKDILIMLNISREIRRRMYNRIVVNNNGNGLMLMESDNDGINDFFNFTDNNFFFTNWGEINLYNLLLKRELRKVY